MYTSLAHYTINKQPRGLEYCRIYMGSIAGNIETGFEPSLPNVEFTNLEKDQLKLQRQVWSLKSEIVPPSLPGYSDVVSPIQK